jgi:hypothetical protein
MLATAHAQARASFRMNDKVLYNVARVMDHPLGSMNSAPTRTQHFNHVRIKIGSLLHRSDFR